jgi:hypothetical protein
LKSGKKRNRMMKIGRIRRTKGRRKRRREGRQKKKRVVEALVMVVRQGSSTGWNGVGSVSCGEPSCLQGPSSRRWRQHL